MADKIIENHNITMEKTGKNKYTLNFSIENNNISVKNMIRFDILQLLYELNKDIFEDFKMTKIDDDNVESYFLLKHFFKDLGFLQKYIHLNIERIEDSENRALLFFCKNSTINKEEIEQINFDHILLKCKIINDHKVTFETNVFFDDDVEVPAFAEKFAGIIISKMLIKVKQFIENISVL